MSSEHLMYVKFMTRIQGDSAFLIEHEYSFISEIIQWKSHGGQEQVQSFQCEHQISMLSEFKDAGNNFAFMLLKSWEWRSINFPPYFFLCHRAHKG